MAKATEQKSTTTKAEPRKLTIRVVLLDALEAQGIIDKADKQIESVRDQREGAISSISEELMEVAKPFGTDYERFLDACKAEEKWLKSDEAGSKKVTTIPRCFIQAKSNIKQAMKLGLDPNDYKSESELRKAKNEANKAAKEEAEGETMTVDYSSDLGKVVSDILHTLHNVPKEQEPQVVAFLKHTHADLVTMLGLESDQQGGETGKGEGKQRAAQG